MLLVMPVLTVGSVVIGIFAAFIVGTQLLGINPTYLWYNMLHYTNMNDIMTGLIKTFVFGAIIAIIACDKGLNCQQGAEGVGRATTEAMVYSSITILISNFFLTLVLNRLLT
jgi:phospholipid/cholesterol/gamma-HCH transport system permease protein